MQYIKIQKYNILQLVACIMQINIFISEKKKKTLGSVCMKHKTLEAVFTEFSIEDYA